MAFCSFLFFFHCFQLIFSEFQSHLNYIEMVFTYLFFILMKICEYNQEDVAASEIHALNLDQILIKHFSNNCFS